MARMNYSTLSFAVIALLVALVSCVPKFDDGGFKPSSIDYTEKSAKAQDQVAMPSSHPKRKDNASKDSAKSSSNNNNNGNNELEDRSQEPRFGFTNVGDSGGYGVSGYAPAKIDLGGLLLGAVIGIGTILVIPKLLYVLSGSYGAYARSEDGGIGQIMTRLDDALARHGIDTTTCMQRVACSYSKQAAEAMRADISNNNYNNYNNETTTTADVSTIDRLIDAFSSNEILQTALRGTAIQEAMQAGRNGQNCARAYQQCGVSADTMLAMLAKLAANQAIGGAAKATASA